MPFESSTIIVVDDDRQVLRSLRFLFETEGFQVRTFESASGLLSDPALSSLPWQQNACLVLDYRMPGINGLDLLACLRDREISLPTVLITGDPDETIDRRAAKAGVIRVFHKPHFDVDLVEGVRQALKNEIAEPRP
jgi:FixJ family two-component response regulator